MYFDEQKLYELDFKPFETYLSELASHALKELPLLHCENGLTATPSIEENTLIQWCSDFYNTAQDQFKVGKCSWTIEDWFNNDEPYEYNLPTLTKHFGLIENGILNARTLGG